MNTHAAAPLRHQAASPSAASDDALASKDLAAQVGAEVASALTSALERVNALALTGRINREGLSQLREEIERARRAGMLGQQVNRIRLRRMTLARERIDLSATVRQVLTQRSRELTARGLQVRQVLHPASVTSDPTLLYGGLQALLDWACEHVSSTLELSVNVTPWPGHAELRCAFVRSSDGQAQATLDNMSWRLLQASAEVLGITLERSDQPALTQATLAFAQSLSAPDEGQNTEAAALAEDEPAGPSDGLAEAINSKPLAGSHLLAVTSRPELRRSLRAVARPLGVMLDFVSSVEEAREFCRSGVPHAVIYDAVSVGGFMQRLLADLLRDSPTLAVVELVEQGRALEVLHVGGHELSRVNKAALADALPQALLFELTRGR
jgi:hypothetical protein